MPSATTWPQRWPPCCSPIPSERATRAALQDRRIPATRTSVLAHAIAWLEARVEQPYDLRALADAVSASPRTLLRHFQQELGHSPLDHLHRLALRAGSGVAGDHAGERALRGAGLRV